MKVCFVLSYLLPPGLELFLSVNTETIDTRDFMVLQKNVRGVGYEVLLFSLHLIFQSK